MSELTGQVAVVTGGSRGIGFAIAKSLAEAGATVAVLSRDGAKAREAAGALPGKGHNGYACDVADRAQVEAVLKQAEAEVGPVDILVNNAGITADGLLLRMSDEQWDRVMETNLRGTFLVTRAVIRGMIRRRKGRIVNITSIVGIAGNAGQANYAASKAAIIGFTKSVARELGGRGILVNAVAPGYIETALTADLPEPARERLFDSIALGRLGQPEDVAPAVRFLVGPGGNYITGQVIVVDGGVVL
ncbi:MAG: 3-oxoacyl-[acyl-carrier-protein] reductase [Gemmatimonadota bacterium]